MTGWVPEPAQDGDIPRTEKLEIAARVGFFDVSCNNDQMKTGMGFRSSNSRGARAWIGAVATVSVVAAAIGGCGSKSDGDSGAKNDKIASVDPRFSELSANGQQLIKTAVTYDEPVHIEMAMGLDMTMGGVSLGVEPDRDQPVVVTDVDSAGRSHTVMDMSRAMQAASTMAGGTGVELPEMKVEQWSDGEWLYMEYIGFDGAASAANPEFSELTAPGIFKLNLEKFSAAADPAGLLAQSTGQSVNVNDYLYAIAQNIDSAEPDPDDSSRQRIVITLGEQMEQGESAGIPMLDGLSDTEGAEELLEAIRQVPVEYSFTTDDKGRVDDVIVDIDLTSFMIEMAATQGGAAAEQFKGATIKSSIPIAIDYDTSIEVSIPEDIEDDRTDAFISVLGEINGTEAVATTAAA